MLSKYRAGIGKWVNKVVSSNDPKVVESVRIELGKRIVELKKLISTKK